MRWKSSPFHGAAFEHASLGRIELVEARGKQRLNCRGYRDVVVVGLANKRDHLLEEQRVPLGRRADPVSQRLANASERVEQAVGLRRVQRLQESGGRVKHAGAPARAGVEQLRTCRAEQKDRRVTRKHSDVLEKVEELLLRPVEVFENANERPLACRVLEQLPRCPRDFVGRGRRRRLAEERAEGRRGSVVRRQLIELFQQLDEWPIRDSLAVREAATRHDPRIDPTHEFSREPRLADSRGTQPVNSWPSAGSPHAQTRRAGCATRFHDRPSASRIAAAERRAPRAPGTRTPAPTCL